MEINEYLIKIFQIAKNMESLGLFRGEAVLSKTEFRLLREIIMEGEKGKDIISSELARRLGITRSAISQLVTKMERRGIVQRVESPSDKKIAYIRLSDKAYATFEEQCRQANAVMERITAEYGEERLKQLISAYDEFASVFRKAIAETRQAKQGEQNA